MNSQLIELLPWIILLGVFLFTYKLIGKISGPYFWNINRFENPILDERELLIRLKVEKVQWRVQASILYLAVFLPLAFDYSIFWGTPRKLAFWITIFAAILAKVLSDYFYRREPM